MYVCVLLYVQSCSRAVYHHIFLLLIVHVAVDLDLAQSRDYSCNDLTSDSTTLGLDSLKT